MIRQKKKPCFHFSNQDQNVLGSDIKKLSGVHRIRWTCYFLLKMIFGRSVKLKFDTTNPKYKYYIWKNLNNLIWTCRNSVIYSHHGAPTNEMQYWIQYSRMILHVIQISLRLRKNNNFRPISGVGNFENFIFGFRLRHQKIQNTILEGVIRGISKIQGCYVHQNSIFDLFGKNCQLVWWLLMLSFLKYPPKLDILFVYLIFIILCTFPDKEESQKCMST